MFYKSNIHVFKYNDVPYRFLPLALVKLLRTKVGNWILSDRADTDQRRAGAARKMVSELEQNFDSHDYILIGDFNDNPDYRSLNILETGNHHALAALENEKGENLINLTEPLCFISHLSHGLNSRDIISSEERVNIIDADNNKNDVVVKVLRLCLTK